MADESLKQKTARGLFWGLVNNGTMQFLNLLFGICLGRLLSPDDYGMVLCFPGVLYFQLGHSPGGLYIPELDGEAKGYSHGFGAGCFRNSRHNFGLLRVLLLGTCHAKPALCRGSESLSLDGLPVASDPCVQFPPGTGDVRIQ